MRWYITRVELHSAAPGDYAKLHEAMQAAGFSLTIPDSTGKRYRLPTAEYSLYANLGPPEVWQKAKTAANSTGKASWVLATQALDWAHDLPAA